MRLTSRVGVTLVLTLSMQSHFATDAAAQNRQENVQKAQELYDVAVALMTEHKYDTACPKLEQATLLVPEGVGAKIELANCYREWGKLASAFAMYGVAAKAAADAGQDERSKKCEQAAAEIFPLLSTLTIAVPEEMRSLPGFEVLQNGIAVPQTRWGVTVPVDAGTYRFRVVAAGKMAWEEVLEVPSDAAKKTITIPILKDEQPSVAPITTTTPTAATNPPLPQRDLPPTHVERSFWSTPRVMGALAGLAGVGLVVGGSYYGLESRAKRDESRANGHCVNGNECDATGFALQKDALSAGTTATWLFVPGLLLGVGGVVLVVAGPSGPAKPNVAILMQARGIELRGRW